MTDFSHPVRGPLTGRLVLDLGRVVAAPYAAQILGDLGAEVIKIERPRIGDDARHYPPVFMPEDTPAADPAAKPAASSAHFVAANRNKQSICVDLSQTEGRELVFRLALQADVLIENFKTGTLARMGLGWEALHASNPRLVYCSITGFGQSGPYAGRPGFDPIVQAMSGMMSVTGPPDGEPGAGPNKAGVVIEDIATGKDAATAILAALYERDTASGLGQHIDTSLFDAAIALMSHAAQSYLLSGTSPTRHPSMGTDSGISGVLDCQDGGVYYTAMRDAQFQGLCRVLGCDALASNPQFATAAGRWRHRALLTAAVRERALAWCTKDLVDALSRKDVPVAPINDLAQAFADPQARHRGLDVPLAHPRFADLRVVASPLRLSRTPVRYALPPPDLGEHTREVLQRRLGLDDVEFDRLQRKGVV